MHVHVVLCVAVVTDEVEAMEPIKLDMCGFYAEPQYAQGDAPARWAVGYGVKTRELGVGEDMNALWPESFPLSIERFDTAAEYFRFPTMREAAAFASGMAYQRSISSRSGAVFVGMPVPIILEGEATEEAARVLLDDPVFLALLRAVDRPERDIRAVVLQQAALRAGTRSFTGRVEFANGEYESFGGVLVSTC